MDKKKKKLCKLENNYFGTVISWIGGGLFSLIFGGLTARLLIPYVYEQRTGFEIGGEWLVVLAVALAAFNFSRLLFIRR